MKDQAIEYKIVNSVNLSLIEFNKQVSDYLKNGWRLYGKPFINPMTGNVTQAIYLPKQL
jgi:hypothetical protein